MMKTLTLETAVKQIKVTCERAKSRKEPSPFCFVVGAGISHPPVPLASNIIEDCKTEARRWGLDEEPASTKPLDLYSHWFGRAYAQPVDRQRYLRGLMEKAFISRANFRLAHLLLGDSVARIVVTPNFDDFLSRALDLFGKRHIVCDHPQTVERINVESADVQIIHVHGTYWFYDCANLQEEVASASTSSPQQAFTMSSLLDDILRNRSPLVVGYSGWEGDVIMGALKRRLEKPLPRNIYWFYYSRAEADGMPDWLQRHPNLSVVLPRLPVTTGPGGSQRGLAGEASTEPVLAAERSPETDASKEPVLKATFVLDALIREFGLEPPRLTRDPLGFFAEQLRQTLWTDEGEEETGDVYSIRALIEHLENAKRTEEETRLKANTELEAMREALRRSDYRSAVRAAQTINLESLDGDQLREVANSMSAAGESLLDDSPEELAAYDLTIDANDLLARRGRREQVLAERVARALFNKGVTLATLKRNDEALATYDDLLRRFIDASELAVRLQVAKALRNKGVTLATLDRNEEAIGAYDELLRRFVDASEPALREQVAPVLFNRGATLSTLNRTEEALAAYDELLRRFADAPEPSLRAQVAMTLVNKGFTLGNLDRNEEAIAVYDDLVRRFADASESPLREQTARALFNKGATLGTLSRNDEALATYDEVLRRFLDSPDPALRTQVAMSLLNKGVTLGNLNRNEEAITIYDDLLRRFSDAPEVALRVQTAMALLNKGVRLGVLDRGEDAIAVYDDLWRRFADAPESALRLQAAKALVNKGARLKALNRTEEAVAAYEEVLRRFSDASDPALREQVALAKQHKEIPLGT
jgi:tetratricopeptide (TPR) repeat protein